MISGAEHQKPLAAISAQVHAPSQEQGWHGSLMPDSCLMQATVSRRAVSPIKQKLGNKVKQVCKPINVRALVHIGKKRETKQPP